MEQLVQNFEEISAIIRSNRNCIEHKWALVRLIDNFYNYHINDEQLPCVKETGILTFVLHQQLNKYYERLVYTEDKVL
jgi:hypothetical protein